MAVGGEGRGTERLGEDDSLSAEVDLSFPDSREGPGRSFIHLRIVGSCYCAETRCSPRKLLPSARTLPRCWSSLSSSVTADEHSPTQSSHLRLPLPFHPSSVRQTPSHLQLERSPVQSSGGTRSIQGGERGSQCNSRLSLQCTREMGSLHRREITGEDALELSQSSVVCEGQSRAAAACTSRVSPSSPDPVVSRPAS